MTRDNAQSPASREELLSLAADLRTALDGFPAGELLGLCLDLPAEELRDQAHAASVVDRVLDAWIAALGDSIECHPPGTMEVLARIRQRLVRSRDALVRLQCELRRLEPVSPGSMKSLIPASPAARRVL